MNDTKIDKSMWGEGPWQHELDEEFFEYEGYPCLIYRHTMLGCLNGYVGVGKGHPLFLKDEYETLDVHGGITFAGLMSGFPILDRKYHNFFWLGFDCAHLGDLVPDINTTKQLFKTGKLKLEEIKYPEEDKILLTKMFNGEDIFSRKDEYRDIEFVRNEVKKLAKQLKDIENKGK